MLKKIAIAFTLLPIFVFSFEKLDLKYCITYGSESAPIEVVEYFSFSCPQCIRLYNKEFQELKAKYIDSGKVRWIFHPDPTDKLTLQAMICIAPLSVNEKQLLLEGVFTSMQKTSSKIAYKLLQKTAEFFGHPFVHLDDMMYLQKTIAFDDAYAFLKQNPPIKDIPTIEINGVIHDATPTKSFIEKQLSLLLTQRAAP